MTARSSARGLLRPIVPFHMLEVNNPCLNNMEPALSVEGFKTIFKGDMNTLNPGCFNVGDNPMDHTCPDPHVLLLRVNGEIQ